MSTPVVESARSTEMARNVKKGRRFDANHDEFLETVLKKGDPPNLIKRYIGKEVGKCILYIFYVRCG